jgi:hypothetical protein
MVRVVFLPRVRSDIQHCARNALNHAATRVPGERGTIASQVVTSLIDRLKSRVVNEACREKSALLRCSLNTESKGRKVWKLSCLPRCPFRTALSMMSISPTSRGLQAAHWSWAAARPWRSRKTRHNYCRKGKAADLVHVQHAPPVS